jgi:type I restriction enzyme S subunit
VRFAGINPAFGWHLLNYWAPNLRRVAQGTTFEAIGKVELQHLPVMVVPLPEQRRIAAILDTLDAAIQATEALLAKLKQAKAGLLHDLLTRGIDEHGRLRDPAAHPEQFKDSPIGRIPREWEVLEISETIKSIIDFRGKTPLKIGMDWGGGNIPALSANNVEMGRINLKKETYYGSERLYAKWMTKGDTEYGDVVMTMEAPLGNVAQIPDDRKYILSQRVILFKLDDSIILDSLLRYQMMDQRFQMLLKRNATGTTATGIQQAKLVRLPIVVPPIHEQYAIAEVLHDQDALRIYLRLANRW